MRDEYDVDWRYLQHKWITFYQLSVLVKDLCEQMSFYECNNEMLESHGKEEVRYV